MFLWCDILLLQAGPCVLVLYMLHLDLLVGVFTIKLLWFVILHSNAREKQCQSIPQWTLI